MDRKIRFRRWLRDAAERVFWTGAQVILASVSVEVLDLPPWAVAPLAVALAAAKALVARKVAEDDSASTITL